MLYQQKGTQSRSLSPSREATWRKRLAAGEAALREALVAYGSCCSICLAASAPAVAVPQGRVSGLTLQCIATDGGRSDATLHGAALAQALREHGWPGEVRFRGRLHRVELRCPAHRRRGGRRAVDAVA